MGRGSVYKTCFKAVLHPVSIRTRKAFGYMSGEVQRIKIMSYRDILIIFHTAGNQAGVTVPDGMRDGCETAFRAAVLMRP